MRQGIPQTGSKFWHDSQLWSTQGQSNKHDYRGRKTTQGHPAEPKAKKLWVQPSDPEEATGKEENTSAT
jgi:hypothetical protein